MANSQATPLSPRRNAALRLRVALTELTSGSTPPTATALCEIANVSRNTLYRYHPNVLRDLHKLQRRQRPRAADSSARRASRQLREDNKLLWEQLAKVAAVVDHYFAAWQEASALLQRRERELADVRKQFTPTFLPIKK